MILATHLHVDLMQSATTEHVLVYLNSKAILIRDVDQNVY